jgi:hypothetical protein
VVGVDWWAQVARIGATDTLNAPRVGVTLGGTVYATQRLAGSGEAPVPRWVYLGRVPCGALTTYEWAVVGGWETYGAGQTPGAVASDYVVCVGHRFVEVYSTESPTGSGA